MSIEQTSPEPHRVELTPEFIASLRPVPGRKRGPYDTKVSALFIMRQAPSKRRPQGKRDYYVNYRSPVTGKAVDYHIGPSTVAPTTARNRAKAVLGKVASGEDPQAAKVAERQQKKDEKLGTGTLEVFVRDHYWPDHLTYRPSGQGTRERIEYAWTRLLKKKLTAITELDIQRGKRERLARVSPQTWNRDLAVLRACLNHAVKHGHLDENPVRPHHKADEVDANRVRYLGQRDEVENIRIDGRKVGEEERFWAALDRAPDYLQVLVTLAMKTGARRGELFSLTWGAVSLTKGIMTLEAHTTKSRQKRTLPMPSTVVEMLRERKPMDAQADDLVVPSPVTGARIYTLKKAWKSLLTDAQVTGFRWHDMRHHYACKLVQRDVSIFKVAKLLGHTDPSLTAKRYADVSTGDLADAVEVLA
jgi:integrase